MKGATFQLAPENPANPHWSSPAVANAALAAAVQDWQYPIGWTRNYYVEIDPLSEGYALPPGVDFIPTIFGDVGVFFGSECTPANIAIAQATSTTGELITFTEPNHPDQSNMTPARAAQLWPMLRASGLRLTSPVIALVTSDPPFGTAGTWIAQFVTALGSADWDVTAFDMYADMPFFNPSDNIKKIAAQLDAAHAAYGKPVWLNETGMIAFGALPSYPNNYQVRSYMRDMIAMCKARPWVERYCWYRIGPGDAPANQYSNITLYSQTGVESAIGLHFADLW
jgi:hypothetical protein